MRTNTQMIQGHNGTEGAAVFVGFLHLQWFNPTYTTVLVGVVYYIVYIREDIDDPPADPPKDDCGRWVCKATCHETPYGGMSASQRIISATGSGPTRSTACQTAIKACQASAARGTYTRHCQCPQCWRR